MTGTKSQTIEAICTEVETQPVVTEVVEETVNLVTTNSEVSLIEVDEFASVEFLDPNARLPRLQALRGGMPAFCGYFVGINEMAKAGFDLDTIVDQLISYTFESSGETEQGLLIKQPRMLVNPRTPLLGFDRAATQEAEQIVILGNWKREYKENDNIGNCQLYEVILLNKQNQPLHSVPLSYVAKGANQATFSQEWQKLTQEVTNCHAIANGIAARPKDARFKSLCVFQFTVGREQVGKKQKSFACRIVDHEIPTLENWKDFFVGYNQTLKKLVWDGLQPMMPLFVPGCNTESPALPGGVEE